MANTAVKQKTTTSIKEPPMYKVIILNDDVTPMEFVILLLTTIFKHSESVATELMLTIHTENSAVVGIYNYEIAEQKTIDATMLARDNGYPLLIKLETK
jgi:ATP-dependent Clp protease adaptor protein ClpS